MKFIFLDIDGVLRLTNFKILVNTPWGDVHTFDEDAVKALNEVLDKTGAEIILSSDWRKNRSLQEMREIFEHFGVNKGPIAFTTQSRYYDEAQTREWQSGGRAYEIKEYVERHQLKDWVAIDDLPLHENYEDFMEGHFAWCDGKKEIWEIQTEIIECLTN